MLLGCLLLSFSEANPDDLGGVYVSPNGDLHVDSPAKGHVLINGMNVVDEIRALKEALATIQVRVFCCPSIPWHTHTMV